MIQTPLVEGLLIDGDTRVASTEDYKEIHNPATGQILAQVPEASLEDVELAVTAAHNAFAKKWGMQDPGQRARLLWRFSEVIRSHSEELARMESQNVGKPIRESRLEVEHAARCFEYYSGALMQFAGETVSISTQEFYFTEHQPYGVCGIITPWNFPLAVAARKIAPAIALGNTVVVKPASLTPLTTLNLGRLALDAGIPPGVINVITGRGSVIGEAIVRHPMVGKVSFTGTTEIGKEVLKFASDHLSRVTLNLGSKSASIIFSDADLNLTARETVKSVIANSGQNCYARSLLLIEKTIYPKFVKRIVSLLNAIKIGDPLNEDTEMGPLLTTAHRQRVQKYIELGKSEGATLHTGGEIYSDPQLTGGAYLTPALFVDVTPKMYIAREEILGPVVCAIPFSSEDEAISIANSSIYGLTSSVWTRNGDRALRVARRILSGVVSVNSNQSIIIEMPHGGMKESGMGRELGMKALEEFCEVKSIFISCHTPDMR